jgi:hypothetical protein
MVMTIVIVVDVWRRRSEEKCANVAMSNGREEALVATCSARLRCTDLGPGVFLSTKGRIWRIPAPTRLWFVTVSSIASTRIKDDFNGTHLLAMIGRV